MNGVSRQTETMLAGFAPVPHREYPDGVSNPSDTPPEPHRFSIPVPRPLSIGLVAAVLVLVSAGLRIGMPIYRQQMTIREIERLGGSFDTRDGGPQWLRDWIGDEPMKLFDDVLWVELDRSQATDATLAQLG